VQGRVFEGPALFPKPFAVEGRPAVIEIECRTTSGGQISIWRSLTDGSLLYLQGDGIQSRGNPTGESALDYVQAICGLITLVEPRSILVLGCGGGTLASMLARRGVVPTLVDVNPTSFEIARTHFGLPPAVPCIVDDAFAFLERDCGKYDCIAIDVYDGFKIPDHLMTVEFGRLCRERLTDRGAIVANVVTAHRWDDAAERLGSLLGGSILPKVIFDTRATADDNTIVLVGNVRPNWALLDGETSLVQDALATYRVR
jgi:SAM-dependent methyltransferase